MTGNFKICLRVVEPPRKTLLLAGAASAANVGSAARTEKYESVRGAWAYRILIKRSRRNKEDEKLGNMTSKTRLGVVKKTFFNVTLAMDDFKI